MRGKAALLSFSRSNADAFVPISSNFRAGNAGDEAVDDAALDDAAVHDAAADDAAVERAAATVHCCGLCCG